MDYILINKHIITIQRITGIFLFIANFIMILYNIFIVYNFFNIIIISCVTGIFAVTIIWINKAMQGIQIIVLALVGILTIIIDEKVFLLGDVLLLLCLFLAYTYRFIRIYSYPVMFSIAGSIGLIQFFVSLYNGQISGQIIATIISIFVLIFFILFLLKSQIELYIRESQKNGIFIQVGRNSDNFLHNLQLSIMWKYIIDTINFVENDDKTAAVKYLETMKKWLRQNIELKKDILSLITDNQITYPLPVDVNHTLDRILKSLFFDFTVYERIEIRKNFSEEKIFVKIIPFELYFLIQNIIYNAVNAMMKKDGNHILTITTKEEKNHIIIIIEDTGPGFELMKKRKNSKLQLDKPGGYGLDYVRSIIQARKGEIHFYNNFHKGKPADNGAVVKIKLRRIKQMKLKILVIDDSEIYIENMTKYLKSNGHDVTGLTNSKTAIENIKKGNYQLIFLDYIMPGIDGIELSHKIKELRIDSRVIFVTENDDIKNIEKIVIEAKGCYLDIISKNADPTRLERALNMLISELSG